MTATNVERDTRSHPLLQAPEPRIHWIGGEERVPVARTTELARAITGLGWSATDVMNRLGISIQMLRRIIAGSSVTVPLRVAEAAEAMWDECKNTSPPCNWESTPYQRRAVKEGWKAPDDWYGPPLGVDPEIDEVAVQRRMGGDLNVVVTQAEMRDAVYRLLARGLSQSEVAERVGVAPRTVCRYVETKSDFMKNYG